MLISVSTLACAPSFSLAAVCLLSSAPCAQAPAAADDDRYETLERRVERLESENAQLRDEQDAISDSYERFSLGGLVPPLLDEGLYGLGPAASKVYSLEQGVSIGGYGELLFQSFAGDSKSTEFDLLRTVLYVGYKFNEHWVLNSEIEFEHSSTDQNGSVSAEFVNLDWLRSPGFNVRAGLLLIPMGFVNERHEPITFPTTNRPQIERRILPTTWRENGFGVFGQVGNASYRAYAVNGFDANGFSASGLRGGRQKGSEALAEDMAFTGRLDYAVTPELGLGGSFYWGDSGQNQAGLGDTQTTIVDLHAEWAWHGAKLRALAVQASLDDVAELNAANGLTGNQSVGEELEGWYVQAAFDLLTLVDNSHGMELSPFVKYESLDTQADVPSGFSADPNNDLELTTFGINFKPIPNIVIKADFQDYHSTDEPDAFNVLVGYAF